MVKEGRPDRIFLLPGLGRGKLAPPRFLRRDDGSTVRVGWDASVFAADWDEDGDLDLILGHRSGSGHLAWLQNHGTRKKPVFKKGKPQPLLVSDERPIRSRFGSPWVADWNGDGRQDLLVGTWKGGVFWHENVGKKEDPELDPAERLVSDQRFHTKVPDSLGRVDQGQYLKICVVDWNHDGLLDLVVGESCLERDKVRSFTDDERRAYYARRQPYRKLCERWQELMDARMPAAKADRQARQEQLAKLGKQMQREWDKIKLNAIACKARVWLVLRKPK